ncbi:hypothetical protein [Sulfolobus spindle-shaped virus]|nr:hypothetical protein [Sulfolobus spindle-shaped virus]
MRWGSDDTYTGKIRRNSPRFRFNYIDYVITIQKAKAQEKTIKRTIDEWKTSRVLSRRGFGISLTRRALCLLHHLRNLFYGIID